MINVLALSSLNLNALYPILMEVKLGKSIQSLTSQSFTLKHNTRAIMEGSSAKLKCLERRHISSSLTVTERTLQLQRHPIEGVIAHFDPF